MKKLRKSLFAGLMCVLMILPSACSSSAKPANETKDSVSTADAKKSSADESKKETEDETSTASKDAGKDSKADTKADTKADSKAGTTENTAEKKLPIEGIDKDNYPYIDGSTANHPLLSRIYREICGVDKETSETMVNFNLGSTGSIWRKLLANSEDNIPDLHIVYEPPEEIKTDYKKDFDNFEIDPLGRDGLVFMVNVNNPVESLTKAQLYDIYTGKIKNWSEVGGNDEEIKPFQRNNDSGSQTLFMKVLMNGDKPMTPPKELVVGDMGGLIDAVAEYSGEGSAIGFSVYYYANLMHSNPNLKLIAVDGVSPEKETIEDKSYPLTNDFYVVIKKSESEKSPVRALRDWLLTSDGRKLLEEENYVWARNGMEEKSDKKGDIF